MEGVLQTNDASERCMEFIRNRCGAVIHDLQTTLIGDLFRITGKIGSWHGKQLASEAARKLFPDLRIDNQLKVIKSR